MLADLTTFVLKRGADLEDKWIKEHRPDDSHQRCTTCNVHAHDGRCIFNLAAHSARRIRLAGEQQKWWTPQ